MLHSPTKRRRPGRFLIGISLAASVLLLALALTARADEFVKKSLITPGDPRPISLNAETISTWIDGSQRIFLLRGSAWIEQGLLKFSMPEGVVWVDEERKKSSGIYNLTVYGEGGVHLREQADESVAGRVLLELATRGEVRIKARGRPVLQTAFAQDPVFVRARSERQAAQGLPRTLAAPAPVPAPAAAVAESSPENARRNGAVNPWAVPPPLASPEAAAWNKAPGTTSSPAADAVGRPTPPNRDDAPAVQQTSWQSAAADAAPSAAQPPAATTPAAGIAPGTAPILPPQTTLTPLPPASSGPLAPMPPNPQAAPALPATPVLPLGPQMPVPAPPSTEKVPLRQLSIRPRSSLPLKVNTVFSADGEPVWVITGGVILNVSDHSEKTRIVDMEADRVVIWSKKNAPEVLDHMKGEGEVTNSRDTEFYLSGNVELRNKTKVETQVLRADEVYYDVSRNVAIALKANLEIRQPRLPYPVNVTGTEIRQLNPKRWEAEHTELFASALPSDPGLKVIVSSSSLVDTDAPRRNIFGFLIKDPKTGEPLKDTEKIFRGRNMLLTIEGVPIFYFPYVQTDPEDPLGPLQNLAFNYNKIFGFQFFSTFNVYDAIGLTPVPGTRWQFDIDYLSARGPALGTNYQYSGKDMFFGIPGRYDGLIKAYGIDDGHKDVLGGVRGTTQFVNNGATPGSTPGIPLAINHPELRGRFTDFLNIQDMPDGFFFQGQINALSDKNFLEQYFNFEYNNNPVQQTFIYGGQRQGNWAWTVLGEDRIRDWYTETNWLPRADGYVIGQKFFDLFTYNVHASAGYAQFLPTHVPPPAYFPTDVNRVNPFRLDLWQDISLPFTLGAVKIVPYAVLDPTYYTDDINKEDLLRVYGGGGIKASLPLSRLYPDVQSDFFNVNGIFHKIVFTANYFNAESNAPFNRLPQLDRLNDDASDQALRNLAGGLQFQLNHANAFNLLNNPLFNPQFYSVRRLLDNHADTLQYIDVLQLDVRQRWQTKRGFPGMEHVVDWMTLDLGASIYPEPNRDNFGQVLGVMFYDWVWNIGDSTSLVSNGWMDPESNGPRVFSVGGNLMRPDRTNFYLGYRQIDPVNSKAIIANISYALSAKYFLTASTVYDFGVHTQVNTLALTRIGTDLQVSLGFSYNSILNTVGVNFAIIPNLFASQMHAGALGFSPAGAMGGGGMGGLGGMSR